MKEPRPTCNVQRPAFHVPRPPFSAHGRRRTPRTASDAFSLIELLIVIAILAVLVAIAIPILLRARMSGNEKATLATMRSLVLAEVAYRQDDDRGRYGTLHDLEADWLRAGFEGMPAAAPGPSGGRVTYPDVRKARQRWMLVFDEGGAWFTCTTSPVSPGVSGRWSFFVDQNGVLRRSRRDGGAGQTDAVSGSPAVP